LEIGAVDGGNEVLVMVPVVPFVEDVVEETEDVGGLIPLGTSGANMAPVVVGGTMALWLRFMYCGVTLNGVLGLNA